MLVAAAYVACAEIGFTLAFTTKQVTAVWPPTGIAVAAILLFGYRVWPGVLIGAFASNASSNEPLPTAAAIAIGNTLGPLACAALLRRLRFDDALERVRDAIALLVAAPIAMAITPTNGVLQLAAAGIVAWHAYGSVWWVWWAGDTMGVLLVTPLLLVLFSKARLPQRRSSVVELTILATALAVVTWLTFATTAPIRLSVYPFVVWAALRFGMRETVFAIVMAAAIAVWGTAHELGTFAAGSVEQRLISLMSFLGILDATGLIVAAAATETRLANDRLRTALDTLVSGFLPERMPQREGFRCDALYLAAGSDMLVGGDWYDAFDLPDGRVVVSIGDVVGHGLTAAIAAGRIRQSIFATAFDSADPADILERVNRTLRADTIATALVGTFDADLRTLRYASAGHPEPIVVPAPAGRNAHNGVPLGIGVEVGARTIDVPLERETVVAFYTDGLVEFGREIAGAEGSLRRALELVAGDGETSPARFVQHAVMGSSSSMDDVALLIVRIAPAPR